MKLARFLFGSARVLAALLVMRATLAATADAPPPLDWLQTPAGRAAAVAPQGTTAGGFILLPPAQTGIWFTNLLPEPRHLTNQILPNGSGVAAGDVDNDGWCDLFFCGLRDSGSQFYRNLGGWRFTNITESAGLATAGLDCTGAALVDFEGDGDLDLAVNSLGAGTRLFLNDGRGQFTAVADRLNPGLGGTSLGFADADGDGDLDLYVANYRVSSAADLTGLRFGFKMVEGKAEVISINGRPLTDPEWTNRFRFKVDLGPGGQGKFAHEERGQADAFYLNDGRGRFQPVSWTGGAFLDEAGQPLAAPFLDWGLAVLFRDLTGDGAPDLYVCNDFDSPDRLWINDGRGRFRLAPPLALRQTSLSSMAVDAADLDRDGHDDLVVLDMLSRDHRRRLTQSNIMRAEMAPTTDFASRPQYPRNTLLRNRGDGTYAEIAQFAGIEGTEWSWNPVLVDVDLDGYEDLLVPNGFVRDNMSMDGMNRIAAAKAGRRLTAIEELSLRRFYPVLNTPNLAFRNLGNLKFAECSQAWGFDQPTISQGACLADLDNDGDLDVVVNNLNTVAGICRNEAAAPRVAVRLRGQTPNTAGVGARITVVGGPVAQSQEIVAGGRYCSGDQAQRTFAAGTAASLEIRVRWRSGRESIVPNASPNQVLEIAEPATGGTVDARARSGVAGGEARPEASIRFTDVSEAIRHRHVELAFDDFDRQPLLPRKLSRLGPGVAWWDLDGDGREELVIGAGRGGNLAGYHNLGGGRFEPLVGSPWNTPVARDTASLIGWVGEMLVALANYEDGATNGPGLLRLSRTNSQPLVPLAAGSFGPVAAADYDGDGQLDLFIGTRVVGGKYPSPAPSALLRGGAAGLELDTTNGAVLPPALVSGAVWTDLTGDGWPELVLACDWGPVRVFRNDRGRLSPWDVPLRGAPSLSPQPSTLDQLTGWWNGVSAGDFDNDGRLDLVASNWGQNSRYERWRPPALRLYFGDFNGDGSVETIESHYVVEWREYAPDRMLQAVARVLPGLAERFPTHQAWAEATMPSVLGEWRAAASQVEAAWLESTLFLNRGDHFEVRPLPAEAQFAPAFAVCVGDADGDGNEDLFLSQNFFGVPMDTSRYDAGRGLWLRGDGRGGLVPVPGQESEVRVYGEQRGAALADFDADGRVDLVVTQNSAETKLFRNVGGKPGLRVRLSGPPGNPSAIGAAIQLRYGPESGPIREVRAGGGYWSQDSPVLVMGRRQAPTGIRVRWPGGAVAEHLLPPEARAVTIRANGELNVEGP